MTGTGPEHQTSEQDATADTAATTDTATGSRTVTRPDSQMHRPVTRPGTRTVSCEQDQTRCAGPDSQTIGPDSRARPDREQIQQTPTAVCIAKAKILYRNS